MRLGLYINENKENLDSALNAVFDVFSSNDNEIIFLNAFDYVKNHIASTYKNGIANKDFDYDILIAIGGDGTIMSAIRSQFHLNRPVIGIHVGYLGFLAESDLDNCHEILNQIKNNKYVTQGRSVFSITVADSNDKKDYISNTNPQ